MPLRKGYPLQALDRHRNDIVQDRARELGLAQEKLGATMLNHALKQRELQEHLNQTRDQSNAEFDRAIEDQATVDDLGRLFAWQAGQRLVAKTLSAQVQEAEERKLQAQRDVDRSRQQLLESHKEAEVVRRHREDFEKHRRSLEEQFEEEEANEASYTLRRKG